MSSFLALGAGGTCVYVKQIVYIWAQANVCINVHMKDNMHVYTSVYTGVCVCVRA